MPKMWWEHPYYKAKWQVWLSRWSALIRNTAYATEVLEKFARLHCDPEVLLRLAFLFASHKPAADHQFVKETDKLQTVRRAIEQAQNHIRKAVQKIEQANSEATLIFAKGQEILELHQVDQMLSHELETLLWPLDAELPPGHELFTLAAYIETCSGRPNYGPLTDLLAIVHEAFDWTEPTQEAATKTVQRFAETKAHSVIPGLIEDDIRNKAQSGELKAELLATFPGQTVP